MKLIDLCSDTQTRPTPEMRQAIAEAEVGDEQKGEDPTVNRLQAMVAELLGKEAALFLPSGTMCNEIAIKVQTRPGDAILAEKNAHIMRFEAGGPAFLSGVLIEQLPGERGVFTPEQVEAAVDPGSFHTMRTSLLCLEQTHNMAGGTIWPLGAIRAVCEVAHANGLKTHCDGARLLNAVVATGIPARDMCSQFDSVWVDFSKGLGAPVGAALAGTAAFVEEARRFKHLFGGAMRQAGIIAAAGVYALEHHVERLAEDHAKAARLAEGLAAVPGVTVEGPIETNIVFFDISGTDMYIPEFMRQIEARGVRVSTPMPGRLRAVTHLDVSREEIERAIEVIGAVLAEAPARSGGAA